MMNFSLRRGEKAAIPLTAATPVEPGRQRGLLSRNASSAAATGRRFYPRPRWRSAGCSARTPRRSVSPWASSSSPVRRRFSPPRAQRFVETQPWPGLPRGDQATRDGVAVAAERVLHRRTWRRPDAGALNLRRRWRGQLAVRGERQRARTKPVALERAEDAGSAAFQRMDGAVRTAAGEHGAVQARAARARTLPRWLSRGSKAPSSRPRPRLSGAVGIAAEDRACLEKGDGDRRPLVWPAREAIRCFRGDVPHARTRSCRTRPVASRAAVGERERMTASVWPASVARSLPLAGAKNLIVFSAPATANRLPSGK